MSAELRVAVQVIAFARRLAPDPRREVKRALQELRRGKGDILPLEGALSGYCRLRVGRHRLIFSYSSDGAIEVVFMEERRLVYEIFEAEFIRRIKNPG